MTENENNGKVRFIKYLPLLGVAVFVTAYFLYGRNIDLKTLLTYTPDNLWLAFFFMMALFAAKSMTFFFPILVLEVLSGIIFPTGRALAINTAGYLVSFTLPYLIGRSTGSTLTDYLMRRNDKLRELYANESGNRFFLSFFLRAIHFLPMDVVSLFLGAQKTEYGVYIIGSLAGVFLEICCATIIGANILDPASPAFIFSVTASVAVAVGSVFLHKYYDKKRKING